MRIKLVTYLFPCLLFLVIGYGLGTLDRRTPDVGEMARALTLETAKTNVGTLVNALVLEGSGRSKQLRRLLYGSLAIELATVDVIATDDELRVFEKEYIDANGPRSTIIDVVNVDGGSASLKQLIALVEKRAESP